MNQSYKETSRDLLYTILDVPKTHYILSIPGSIYTVEIAPSD
jgi:hypothetical protein